MKFATRCGGLVVAGLLALLPATSPRAADIYAVSGIEVDVSAESAVEARAAAIDEAERTGLARLMARIAEPGREAALPAVEDLPIDRYVRSFEVEEEKVSSTRYIASIGVSYDGEAVQDLLKGSGAAIVLGGAEPLLVVPALGGETGVVFWAEPNPWRDAWSEESGRNTLLDIRLPLGDLRDVAAINERRFAAGTGMLEPLAERYRASGVLVLVATPTPEGAEIPERIEVRQADVMEWQPFSPVVVDIAPGATAGEAWRAAAREAMQRIEAAWKRDNLVRFDNARTLAVTVPLVDLEGWSQIRRKLDELPQIRDVAVKAFAQRQAELAISFVGGIDQLQDALARSGLSLAEETNLWLLRQADAGRAPR